MSDNKKYIILDIDATLVHTHGEIEKYKLLEIFSDSDKIKYRKKLYSMKLYDVSGDPGLGNITVLSGIYRPYLKEFLDFCFIYFDKVIIWSAGRKKYVEKMCQIMFPLEDQPDDILTYNDCDLSRGVDNLKKPISKVFKRHPEMNYKNTFIVDDRDDTFSLNSENGIQIPEYESDLSVEDITSHPDDNLLKLIAWFSSKKIMNCKDIRKLDKSDIFKKSLEEYKKEMKKK
tara:strand:+ start:816 stop:1505 length:690 start_codon:yes stop_codon:yes gene_type:complete